MTMYIDNTLLTEKVIEWLCSHLKSSGRAGYVLGVSGGVDSLVSAMITYEACKRLDKKLRLLSLPIVETPSLNDDVNIEGVFKEKGIDVDCIDLSKAYQEFKKVCFEDLPATAWPTIKHRLRMTYVYTIAKRENLLVVGTVNGVEFKIGYFAKWSSLGDVLPLANLSKHQIREIAKTMGLSDQIVSQKASGCVKGGCAEDEWGFKEEEADMMISGEKDMVNEKVCEAFDKMVKNSAHKRTFVPIFNPGL